MAAQPPTAVLERPSDLQFHQLTLAMKEEFEDEGRDWRVETCSSRVVPPAGKATREASTCCCGGNTIVDLQYLSPSPQELKADRFPDPSDAEVHAARVCATCDGVVQWPRYGMETVWE